MIATDQMPTDGMSADETVIANVEMAKAWDGEEGERWARDADRYDATGVHIRRVFFERVPFAPGEHVLDIGCGAGRQSLDIARRVAPGTVLGIDLSSQLLDLARQRSSAEGLANVGFRQADAQVEPFDAGRFDVAVSSFGAMFFADPAAAFANIGRALRPGGRLAVMAWGPFAGNEWLATIRDALAIGRPMGTPPSSVPGPFGLADADFTRAVLAEAGFEEVDLEAIDEPIVLGADAADAFAFVRTMGIVKGMTHDLDEADTQRALDAVRAALVAHETADGVLLGAEAWLITARRV